MRKFGNKIAMALLVLMASMAFVPAASAAEAVPESTGSGSGSGCSGCGCGGSNVTVVELNGSEANKAIAEALKNGEVKQLRKVLIKNGHTPKVNNATVLQTDAELYVLLPFRPGENFTKAGLSYIQTENGTRAVAIEEYTKENKTYANIYSIDEEGNIISQTVDIDWECWIECAAEECGGCFIPAPTPPGLCTPCCFLCDACIAVPNYLTCGSCAACVGVIVGYQCSDQC